MGWLPVGCWEVYRVWHGTGRLQVGRSSPRCVYIDIDISGLAWNVNVNLYTYIGCGTALGACKREGHHQDLYIYRCIYIYRYIWLSPECNRKSIYIHRVWHGTGCLQAGRSSPRTVYIYRYIHTYTHSYTHTYVYMQLSTTPLGAVDNYFAGFVLPLRTMRHE